VLNPWQQFSGWLFDLHAQRWTPIPVSPIPGGTNNLDPITAAFLEGQLVVWGLTKGPPHGAALDVETMRWKPIAEAPINVRVRALAQPIGEKLYVLGGFGPNPPLINARFGPQTDGAVYDLGADEWQKLPDFGVGQRGFYGHVVTRWGDRIVVFDGRGGAILDQGKGGWEPIPATPSDNGGMAACTVANGEMLIWSGRSAAAAAAGKTQACADAAVFDFVTRKWEQVPHSPLAPRYLSYAKAKDRTVTIWGGWDSSARPAKFYRDAATFDLEKRVWQRIADLPGDVPYALHPGW
jgi:N-acetylneuraminic acid mutarotase